MRISGVIAIGVVLLLWLGRSWLDSYVLRTIAQEVTKAADVRMDASHVSLRANGIVVHNVRITNVKTASKAAVQTASAASQHEEPLFVVPRVVVTLPLWDAIKGNVKIQRVELHQPHVRLAFSKSGQLIAPVKLKTGQASDFETIDIHDGTAELLQDGFSPVFVRGIDLQATSTDGTIQLSGSVDDAFEARWQLSGSSSAAADEFVAKIETQELTLTHELIASRVPSFALPEAVESAMLKTAVAAAFSLKPNQRSYEITAQPQVVHCRLQGHDLTAEFKRGVIVATGESITCQQLEASLSEVPLSADFSYDISTQTGQAELAFRQLNTTTVQELLPQIDLLAELGGHLSGSTQLALAKSGASLEG